MAHHLFCTLFGHEYSDPRLIDDGRDDRATTDRAQIGRMAVRTCIFCGHQHYEKYDGTTMTEESSASLPAVVAAVALALAALILAVPAHAQPRRFEHHHTLEAWHGGHWIHGVHGGRGGWWWVVGGVWYFYPAPVYPYPEPPPTVVLAPAPAPAAPAASYYYYCRRPAGYYPYVHACRRPWEAVPVAALPPTYAPPPGAAPPPAPSAPAPGYYSPPGPTVSPPPGAPPPPFPGAAPAAPPPPN